jgi:hypothetical protein
MLTKVMKMHMLLSIAQCVITIATFALWMSKTNFDMFVLMINFINYDWVPYHVTIRLFEALDTFGATLVEQMKYLLTEYQLTSKIITYVKDESTNLNTFAFAFASVAFCAPLQLVAPFNGTCFGHVTTKACQYATNDIKIGVGMKEVCNKSSKCLAKNHYMDKEIREG